tara:strand:+ start:9451 stop:10020 length:570 start_codon:yes stop_codon:yes gene_type:complete
MRDPDYSESHDNNQRIILTSISFLLIITLFFVKAGFNKGAPLEELVRNSITPNEALSNEKATVLEFYADWCESCKSMAPNMIIAEKKYSDLVNVVMLNVDNPTSQDFIETYDVKGIPQLNFLDNSGNLKGTEIGFRTADQIDKFFSGLLDDQKLSELSLSLGLTNLEDQSALNKKPIINQKIIQPRSHS